MSTDTFDLDSFLDSPSMDLGLEGDAIPGTESNGAVAYTEPGYEGKVDYRIRQLSYSSLLTLHTCPRKFQLYRLRTVYRNPELEKSTITFAFGHVVGDGIQRILAGCSENEVIWQMFLGWDADLLAVDEKAKKSFWTAVIAIRRFISMREAGLLDGYELVTYQDKPACELSFSVSFPDGFRLRGFVDAVLRHKDTGQVLVLECKTTGATSVNPAQFKNSAQAIGYSIVLDVIFPGLSSYEVLYLVYQTTQGNFHTLPFTKSYLQRALWIRELLLDIEMIKMYEEAEVYPMRGESCYSFFRECEYINTCTLSTDVLTNKCTEKDVDKTEYQINLTLQDLLEAQFAKVES